MLNDGLLDPLQADAWRKITLVYYPSLSAYVDQDGRSEPVAFEIPRRLDPARGRIAGTEPRPQTEPILIGVKTDDARTQPAAATRPHTQPAD